MSDIQLVVFAHDNEGESIEYGAPIEQVQEINRVSKITPLPQTLDFIEGVINLRGMTIPVIDLKKRFGIGSTKFTENTRIIVFNTDDQNAGILVDEVNEVINVSTENIEPLLPILSAGISSRYLKGIAKVDKRLIIMLDLTMIITKEENQEITRAV